MDATDAPPKDAPASDRETLENNHPLHHCHVRVAYFCDYSRAEIDMTTHPFIAGTDVASIGIWDRKWSDPAIREKSLAAFLKRLPADAANKQLFYIETGGDGDSSIEVHVDDDFVPDERYENVGPSCSLEISSGEAIVDGIESYGSEYDGANAFPLENARYTVDVYVLRDPELEASQVIPEGPARKPHPLEKFAWVGLLLLGTAVVLAVKKKFLLATPFLTISLLYSYALHRLEKKMKKVPPAKFRVQVTTPYLVICMRRTEPHAPLGGHVSLT